MPEIRIIPFTPEYAGELGQLHWQVWEETYRGLIPDAYLDTFTPEKWTEKARRDTLSSFLLFADGELAGFASCSDPARESVPVTEDMLTYAADTPGQQEAVICCGSSRARGWQGR